MTVISLKLPDDLVRKISEAADKTGISRTELIRVVLEHELAVISKRPERADMARAIEAMRTDPDYEQESALLDQGLMEYLPSVPGGWWSGDKC